MGEFSKQVLSSWIENECIRQLFINLGKDDPNWISPLREIIPLESIRRNRNTLVMQFGAEYEQEVYSQLVQFLETVFEMNPQRQIVKKLLQAQDMEKLYQDLKEGGTKILLEHGFQVPMSFFSRIFGMDPNRPLPVKKVTDTTYPDILVLGAGGTHEIDPYGNIIKLGPDDTRISINILDIKKTSEENVSKKQFIEIVFYGLLIHEFLQVHNLLDKFYVSFDNNGIFPGVDNLLQLRKYEQLFDLMVPVAWKETMRLFTRSKSQIQRLLEQSPMPLEMAEVNISPRCGRCNYYDDCRSTLEDPKEPGNMSCALLPYTSMATVKQLNDLDITTVGELAKKIDSLDFGDTPNPLYPIIPMLNMKAKSLAYQKKYQPSDGELFSVSIPKYNDISLVINFEEDPLHSRTIAFGIVLDTIVGTSVYQDKFQEFWSIWYEVLEGKMDEERAYYELESRVSVQFKKNDFREIHKILGILKKLGAELNLKGHHYINKEGQSKIHEYTRYGLEMAILNEGLSDKTEYDFTRACTRALYYILRLVYYLETYISELRQYPDRNNQLRDFYFSPNSAIFYWSAEIIEIFERLLERQLVNLLGDEDINSELSFLVSWFTPSESGIKEAEQLKKIFDLRLFVETTQSFPLAINYTWHGINELITGFKASGTYFSPHFNYMDQNQWYEFLRAKESSTALLDGTSKTKSEYRAEISRQVLYKTRTINNLKQIFQKNSRHLISSKRKNPIKTGQLVVPKLPRDYHDIARIWFLYYRLAGAISEQEADYYRFMYPQFSIGKLAVAEVSNLRMKKSIGARGADKFSYHFELRGPSSNMKVKEKDQFLLVPSDFRDRVTPWTWDVAIKSMEWDAQGNIHIITEEKSQNLYFEYQMSMMSDLPIRPEKWYLFPKGGEFWTSKLKILLGAFNLGDSWLGKRLSYLWEIDPKGLEQPDEAINLHEVYMFSPTMLYDAHISSGLRTIGALSTNVKLPPNPSQKRAIINSMNSVISSIQGPPGTGKSQTIVALIDEFLRQHDRPVHILVTSFSYQAINVLVEKVAESVDADDQPTQVARIPRVYLHSQGAAPHPLADNLSRQGNTWKINGEARKFVREKTLEDHYPGSFIVFGIGHQLHNLYHARHRKTRKQLCIKSNFAFDLIIVDEASQMPTDQILASLMYIRPFNSKLINIPRSSPIESTSELNQIKLAFTEEVDPNDLSKLVFVGDFNQLPPVQTVDPPKKLTRFLGSVFSYYIEEHKVKNVQLEINYRSHEIIVEFTRRLGFYQRLGAFPRNAKDLLPGDLSKISVPWVQEVMDPSRVVGTIIHGHQFETAMSVLETQITVELIMAYYLMRNPQTEEDEKSFFLEEIGVVAPHNAQGRAIIRAVKSRMDQINSSKLDSDTLMQVLSRTIFSVEKFQGSDRNLIISTIGISSLDQLRGEEDFIYDINRFNVLTSRAKNKMILICSRNFLEYFPMKNELIQFTGKINEFALEFCNKAITFDIKCEDHLKMEKIEFRYRDKL